MRLVDELGLGLVTRGAHRITSRVVFDRGCVLAGAKPMPADQLEIRLASLVETALGPCGPGLSTSAKVIGDVVIDCAVCSPGRGGDALAEQIVGRMTARLNQHRSVSGK